MDSRDRADRILAGPVARHRCHSRHGWVHLADDRNLTITVTGASVAVLTAMERTGAVWLAGEPRPGPTVIIGYPLLDLARLS